MENPPQKKKKRKTRSNPHLSLIRDGGTQHELLADRLDPEGLGVVLTLFEQQKNASNYLWI
jgi:hypothetical protein